MQVCKCSKAQQIKATHQQYLFHSSTVTLKYDWKYKTVRGRWDSYSEMDKIDIEGWQPDQWNDTKIYLHGKAQYSTN